MQSRQCTKLLCLLCGLLCVGAQLLCPFRNGVECDGRGACVGGVCNCEFGFGGEDCSLRCATDSLLVPCSGHGQCGMAGVCICNPGWAGEICAQACPGGEAAPCSFRGECVSDGRAASCLCQRGNGSMVERYEGEACHVAIYNVSSRVEQRVYDQPEGVPAILALPLVAVLLIVCLGLYFHEDNFFGELAHGSYAVAWSIVHAFLETMISFNIAFFNFLGPSRRFDDDRSDAGSDSVAGDDTVTGAAGPVLELESLDNRKELEGRIKAAFNAAVFLRDHSQPQALQEGFCEGLRMLGLEPYLSVGAISRVRRLLLRKKVGKAAQVKRRLMAVALGRADASTDTLTLLKDQFRLLALECHRQMLFRSFPLRAPIEIAQDYIRALKAERALRRDHAQRQRGLRKAPSSRSVVSTSRPSLSAASARHHSE